MSLLKPKPPVPKPIDPVQVKIADPGYKGVTVDSAVTPLASIIQYIEGQIWQVEYFSQVLGLDSEPQPHQLDRSATYQQYVLIKGLELKVNSPLAVSQDPESRAMTLEGSAYVATGVIPNKGDCFFADIGQGREAQLTVTSVEKKTHFKQTVYQINYEVTHYSDHDVSAIRQDLDSKLVKVVHFVKDFNYFGQNPLMLSEDFNFRIEFQKHYARLAHYYLNDFYSRQYRTLLIPDQSYPSYDPYLIDGILQWISVQDHPDVVNIQRPQVNRTQQRSTDTVWTALNALDPVMLKNAIRKTGLLHRSYFKGQPDLAGVFYMGVSYVVYKTEGPVNVDEQYKQFATTPVAQQLDTGKLRFDSIERLEDQSQLDGFYYAAVNPTTATGEPALPMVIPVSRIGSYVFSEDFYKGTAQSQLERLILQALQYEQIDKKLLNALCEQSIHWHNLERFYYIPALLCLLQTALRKN